MKSMKKLIFVSLAVAAASLYAAADETVIYDLRVDTNFDPTTQFSPGHDRDDYIWKWARYTAVSNNDASGPEMYHYNITEPYYADIFMTRDIDLQPGVTYSVVSRPRCRTGNKTGHLTIMIGQGVITESTYDRHELTTLGDYDNIPYVNTYSWSSLEDVNQIRCDFTVSTAGKYKICFYGQGNTLTLHDTYIVQTDGGGSVDPEPDPIEPVPDPVIPGGAQNLSATVSGSDVTVSFNMPSVGTAGESLEGEELKYTIYRDDLSISTKSRQTAGAAITYVDSNVDYGTHTYGVEIALGEETSSRETVSVEVKRPVVEPATSLDLPVNDSFAGASFGEVWYVEEVSGDVNWEASDKLTSQLPLMDVYDADGGMAVFRGWDGKEGDYARLSTAPITKSSSSAPVLDFMFGHSGARATTDKVKVQVSADGGEWQDVEGAVIATYIESLENGGWTYYKYALDPYIQNCTTYRVGFLGVCERLNANIPIDAVNIYNVVDKDVSITELDVPAEATAGGDIEVALTIENLGGATLKASDYTVTVESDYPVAVELTPVDIPSLTSVRLAGKVIVTAEEVLDGPDYKFVAKVNVPGNESGENLVSDEKTVKTLFVEHKVPANATAICEGEKLTGISWESVKDLEHTAINISETFNDLQERVQVERETEDGKTEKVWVDGTKGNFNGFISVDLDKQDGGSYYSTSGSEFQVFTDFMTGSMPQGHSGKYIGLTLPANIQQDDWLITPALDAAESSVINFGARIAYIHRESDSYNNSLEVLYATDDYNPKNPAPSFTKSLYSNTSKATSGDLPHDGLYHWLRVNNIPAEAKYVAIHFNTKSGMQTGVWVDRLTVTETDLYPLTGYYVYRRNEGRLNAEPVDKTQLSYMLDEAVTDSQAQFYVTALYADGESQPSEFVSATSFSGVSAVDAAGPRVSVIPSAVLISGANGETARVYTPDGKLVSSAKCAGVTVLNLNPGLYIVKVGTTVAKALVK